MWVWLSIRKEDASKIALGQSVEIEFDGRRAHCSGKIAWVSTEIDAKTRTLQARVDVANPYRITQMESLFVSAVHTTLKPTTTENPRELMVNMYGNARITVSRMQNCLLIPDAAVQTLEVAPKKLLKIAFVAKADNLTFETRSVTPGRTRDGMTHIVQGLQFGDRVVSEGSYVLKSELMLDSLSHSDK